MSERSNEQQSAWLEELGEVIILKVIVVPGASRTRVMGLYDGRLKIQLEAPPAEGQANKALVHFLSTVLKAAKSQISLNSGAGQRRKSLVLRGIPRHRALMALIPPDRRL